LVENQIQKQASTSEKRLRSAQIRHFFTQSRLAGIGAFIASGILAVAMLNYVPMRFVLIWFVVCVPLYVWRLFTISKFFKTDNDEATIENWGRQLSLATAAGAAWWGVGAVLMFPPNSPEGQLILTVCVAGSAAAAIVVYTATNIYALATTVQLVPLAARFFYQADNSGLLLGMGVLLFTMILLLSGKHSHSTRVDFITLGFENEELVMSLRESRTHLEEKVEERTSELHKANESLTAEISRREAVEKQLKGSEEKYRLLVETSTDAIFIAQDGMMRFLNSATSLLIGLPQEEILNKPFIEFIHPDDREMVVQRHYMRLKGENPVNRYPIRIIVKDGDIRWLEISLAPIEWEGKPAVLVFGSDVTKRKETEEALRDSEHNYKTLVDFTPDGMALVINGKFAMVNPSLVSILDADSAETLHGRFVLDYVPSDYRELAEHNAKLLLTDQERLVSFEQEIRRTDGTVVPVDISAVRLLHHGDPAIQLVLRDTSYRKKAEKANEMLRRFMESVSDGFFAVDKNLVLTYFNNAAQSILGKNAQDVLGKPFFDVFPEAKESGLHSGCRRAIEEKRSITFEIYFDVSPYENWYEVRVFPFDDGLSVYFRITTEAKAKEEALKASEEKYRRIVETANEGIWSVDAEGLTTSVNKQMADMLGYTREEMIGKSFAEFADPEWASTAQTHWRLRMEGFPEQHDFKLNRKDGGDLWCILNATPIMDANGRFLGGFVMVTDIGDRKKSQEILLQNERLLAVADLASGVAHNFNNLLQILLGNAELALMDAEVGDIASLRRSLSNIIESSKFGAETVRRLQSFANLRKNMDQSQIAVFDLSGVVRQAVEMTRPLWKSTRERDDKEIYLNQNYVEKLPVLGKQNEIFEVAINLIKNAVESIPSKGSVTVSTRLENDEAVLEVSDDGVGIPEEDMKKVFDPFWSTKGLKGTGMGLSISYGIITRHKGTIGVKSRMEKGSTFFVRLPLADSQAEDVVEENTVYKPLTILVVDDLKPVLDLLTSILESYKHKVISAEGGREAIDILEREYIDLVICDLAMPEVNGWEVGKAVKRICEDRKIDRIPFLLLTGFGGQNLEESKIVEAGIDSVLEKPIDEKGLMAAIARAAYR
jgi:two-component system, cell cycle sensor histidine kinase and response regulator CckA